MFPLATHRGICAPGVAVEENEIIVGHRHAEDCFQDHEPGRPGVELFEPGQRSEQFRILDSLDDIRSTSHGLLSITAFNRSQR